MMQLTMTETVAMNAPQMLRRYGPWLAAGIVVLVGIGAVGRESPASRPIADGYSVVTVGAAGQEDSVAGYVPVQMHQPLSRHFQPTKDMAKEEVPDQYRRLNLNEDTSAGAIRAAMIEEDDQARKKKEEKEQKKNDMFASLKDKEPATLDRGRDLDTDDSASWGWLAEGVQEDQGRVGDGSSEGREPSPMASSLRNDLFSEESSGGPKSTESPQSGSSFSWRSLGEEKTP